MALDLQWRYRGWHLQSELITQQRNYLAGDRQAATNPFTGQPIFPTDFTSWGAYGLLGYGFDVRSVNIMPWFMVTAFNQLAPSNLTTHTNGFVTGVNVRPVDALVVKLAYQYAAWPDGNPISDKPIHIMQTQLAWAF